MGNFGSGKWIALGVVAIAISTLAAFGQTCTVTASPSALTIYPKQQNVPVVITVGNSAYPGSGRRGNGASGTAAEPRSEAHVTGMGVVTAAGRGRRSTPIPAIREADVLAFCIRHRHGGGGGPFRLRVLGAHRAELRGDHYRRGRRRTTLHPGNIAGQIIRMILSRPAKTTRGRDNVFSGVAPPVERTEADFDAGAKNHVPTNVPYVRYFLARIYQFQFYKAMCDASGYKGPLNRCSFYGSKTTGDKLNKMLEAGQSQPWQQTPKEMTGSDHLDAQPMLDYFAPLYAWLKEQNKNAAR